MSTTFASTDLRVLGFLAAVPPPSAESLWLSVLACLILGGYASSAEAQPQKNLENLLPGKAEPIRTVRRQKPRAAKNQIETNKQLQQTLAATLTGPRFRAEEIYRVQKAYNGVSVYMDS
jgi:hypothetical protein